MTTTEDSEQKYDVVIDVLQKHYNKLAKMDANPELDFGIMTQIRMEQRKQIEKAIRMWKASEYGLGR